MSLYIVGIGPGSMEGMTLKAKAVIEACHVIIGYTVYTELVRVHYPEKEYYSTPMRQERERCVYALERAAGGCKVALVCSGDAGIYGMAGLVFWLREEMAGAGKREIERTHIEVVAGVTAASSGAALLGAPLTNDFAVISLSDLLTPAETIRKRLRCAAMGDMVICLYNPSSKKRAGYLKAACDIILEYRGPGTVCGYVKNIGRAKEEAKLLTLGQLREAEADMFTTVYIGCEATEEIGGRMVTPRGYRPGREKEPQAPAAVSKTRAQDRGIREPGACTKPGRIYIFGGTTEGRLLYGHCMEKGIPARVCVATSYGREVLEQEREERGMARTEGGVDIREGRLTAEGMERELREGNASLVLDATHPHAREASRNIRAACLALGIPCRRVLRESGPDEGTGEREEGPAFDTVEEAVSFLAGTEGNILVTTGSRELRRYTALADYKRRLYVRVLPDRETMDICMSLGIRGRHILAMQGPFSEGMNRAVIKEFDIRWMVTKQSGAAGGFPEKRSAARAEGISLLVIRDRENGGGIGIGEAKQILEEWK